MFVRRMGTKLGLNFEILAKWIFHILLPPLFFTSFPLLVSPVASHYTSNDVPTQLPMNSQYGTFPMTRHSVVLAAQSDNPAARSRPSKRLPSHTGDLFTSTSA